MNKTEEDNSLRVLQRTNNVRFEALMKTADFRRQVREARMSFERQVTLAAWALLLGIASTLKEADGWLVIPAVMLIVFLHATWTWRNFSASEHDAKRMWEDYDKARLAACLPHQQPPESDGFPSIAAVVVTIALGFLVVLYVSGKPN